MSEHARPAPTIKHTGVGQFRIATDALVQCSRMILGYFGQMQWSAGTAHDIVESEVSGLGTCRCCGAPETDE